MRLRRKKTIMRQALLHRSKEESKNLAFNFLHLINKERERERERYKKREGEGERERETKRERERKRGREREMKNPISGFVVVRGFYYISGGQNKINAAVLSLAQMQQ
jgi:hypothetical protein